MPPTTRYIATVSGIAVIASASVFAWYSLSRRRKSQSSQRDNMTVTTPFQTLFAVPMSCEGCAKDVSDSLYKLKGITQVEANVKDQLVSIKGTAPPSAIVQAIEATGRDAILRGSGSSNSSAVSILETYHRPAGAPAKKDDESDREVRGLARMVQVAPAVTLVDLTLRGVTAGTYRATIRQYGDLKDGVESTGPVWAGEQKSGSSLLGDIGSVEVGADGRGSAFINMPLQVWEIIGHAMVVTRQDERAGLPLKNDENTVVGVVARSAGMWDNDKTVCSCTGKTLWDERKDEVQKGML